MGIIEILLIAVGLAMDAFAVSICKGLSMKKLDKKKMIIIRRVFWTISRTYACNTDTF